MYRLNRGLTVCRFERMRQGIPSASEAAKAANVRKSLYIKFEGGFPWKTLNDDEIQRVAALLGLSVEEIADDKGVSILYKEPKQESTTETMKGFESHE